MISIEMTKMKKMLYIGGACGIKQKKISNGRPSRQFLLFLGISPLCCSLRINKLFFLREDYDGSRGGCLIHLIYICCEYLNIQIISNTNRNTMRFRRKNQIL